MTEPDGTVVPQSMERTGTSPLRVVIVDNAGDFCHLMHVVLEPADRYEVVGEARNGLEALAPVRRHEPELVLLDISMPTMGGFEALSQIREAYPDTAIVVLSIFAPSTVRDHDMSLGGRARSLGAAGYIQKGQKLSVLLSHCMPLSKPRSMEEVLARSGGAANRTGRPPT